MFRWHKQSFDSISSVLTSKRRFRERRCKGRLQRDIARWPAIADSRPLLPPRSRIYSIKDSGSEPSTGRAACMVLADGLAVLDCETVVHRSAVLGGVATWLACLEGGANLEACPSEQQDESVELLNELAFQLCRE